MHTPQENEDMASRDALQERIAALEQRTEHLQQQTRTVERRLRWWRGFACGMVILALRSWSLQTSHAVLAAQVEAMQHDIAALQALLWSRIAASTDQRDPEVVLTEVHRRLVPSASGSNTRPAPATDYWAAGVLFADN
jgi:hypothetical protein